LESPPACDSELVEYVRKRFRWSVAELEAMMTAPKHTMRDYPTYKRTFERLRPLFERLADQGKIPRSFVLRYCHPQVVAPFTGHRTFWPSKVSSLHT